MNTDAPAPLTPTDLAVIRARAELAQSDLVNRGTSTHGAETTIHGDGIAWAANAVLCEDVPRLIAEVQRLSALADGTAKAKAPARGMPESIVDFANEVAQKLAKREAERKAGDGAGVAGADGTSGSGAADDGIPPEEA